MYTVIFLNSNLYHSENNLLYSNKHYYYVSIHPYVLEINFMGLIHAGTVVRRHLHVYRICTCALVLSYN